MSDNLYELLEVSRAASPEVIRAAYYVLARTYHPDVNPGADAARRMRRINNAYAVLSDLVQRAQYDAQTAQAARGTRYRRTDARARSEERARGEEPRPDGRARHEEPARPEAPARPAERARGTGRIRFEGRGHRARSAARLDSEPRRLGLSPLGRTVLAGLIMTVVVAVAIGLWAALDALDDGMIRPSAASDSIPAFAVPLPAPDVPADLPSSQ